MFRFSNIAALAALSVAVLLIGGVHTETATLVAALAAVAAGTQLFQLRQSSELRISLIGAGLFVLTAAAVLQIVPLPWGLVSMLNPEASSIAARGVELAGLEPWSWARLSVEPAATADRVVRFGALALLALWAANVRSRSVPWSFVSFINTLALAAFAVGFVLSELDVRELFGFFDSLVGFRGPSPFISLNHSAVFFGFVAFVGGCKVVHDRATPRAVNIAGAMLSLAFLVVALTFRSEGVNLALALTAIFAGIVGWSRAGRPLRAPRHVAIGLTLLAALLLALAIWLDVGTVIFDFVERATTAGEHGARRELLAASSRALADYWVFGAGAGALETMIAGYVDWSVVGHASIPVVENDTFEILLGYGVFVGGLALAAFGAQFILALPAAFDGRRSERHAAGVVTAFFVAIVAQFHFPSLPLGLAAPIVVWLELAWSRRTRTAHDRRFARTGHFFIGPKAMTAVQLTLAVMIVGAAVAHFGWRAVALPENDVRPEAVEAFLRARPLDHRIYVRLAKNSAVDGETLRAVELADFAVDREPSPRVQAYRARVLAITKPDAGVAAYRKLFASSPKPAGYVRDFVRYVPDPEVQAEVLADYPELWELAVETLRRASGPDAASSLVVELAELRPDAPELYLVATQTYARMKRPVLSGIWAQLLQEKEQHLPEAQRNAPYLIARSLVASGQRDEAREILDEQLGTAETDPRAHRLALELRQPPGEATDEERERLRQHYARVCRSPIPKNDVRICWTVEAWLAEEDGKFSRAERVLQRIGRRFDDPRALASFYVRTGQCEELGRLARQQRSERLQRQFRAMMKSCRR